MGKSMEMTVTASREVDSSTAPLEAALVIAMVILSNPAGQQSTEIDRAFEIIHDELIRYVAWVLKHIFGKNPEHAADLVQEVFVRFMTRKIALKYDPLRECQRGSFLRGVAWNVMRDFVRGERNYPKMENIDDHQLTDCGAGPAAIAERTEVLERLRDALATLKPEYLEALLGRFAPELAGSPTNSVAPSTRYQQTFRAKQALNVILARFGPSDDA